MASGHCQRRFLEAFFQKIKMDLGSGIFYFNSKDVRSGDRSSD